jgi:hypothetical protein
LSRSISSAVLAGLALLITAAPASAERLHTPDATGDVWTRGSDGVWSQATPRPNSDVVGSSVRHTDTRVNASVRYDDLQRTDSRTVLPLRLRTSAGQTFLLRFAFGPGDRDGTATLLRDGRTSTTRVACEGLQHSVRYDDDLVGLSVPRRCVGRPAWVRYGGVARDVGADGGVLTDALLSGDPVNDLYSIRIARG